MNTLFAQRPGRHANVALPALSLLFASLFASMSVDAGASTKTKPVSPEQRKLIETVVYDYLINNPAVIRDAMVALQKQEEEQEQQQAAQVLKQHSAELFNDPASPVGGNPKGDVTVVQFFDYQCGYCKRVAPALDALLQRDSNVRVVYKEFAILGPQSTVAALAALAAQRQGNYADFHRELMSAESVDDTAIKAIAEKSGLNFESLQKDMEDPAIKAALDNNFKLASALGITGTPTFVIGDRLIPGAVSAEVLVELVGKVRLQHKASGAIANTK